MLVQHAPCHHDLIHLGLCVRIWVSSLWVRLSTDLTVLYVTNTNAADQDMISIFGEDPCLSAFPTVL